MTDIRDLEANTEVQMDEVKSGEANSTAAGNGLSDDLVQIGKHVYKREELQNAWAGELQPGIHPAQSEKWANPVPLGLAATAIPLMGLSLINCQIHGVSNASSMAGAAIFYGGTIQALSGFMCFFTGNTYGMTVLGSYGGFWLSLGAVLTKSFGIVSAYKDVDQFEYAFGYYLSAFTIFSFIVLLCTLKASWALFALIFFLFWTFFLLTLSAFLANSALKRAAGYFGLFASFAGFYDLYAGLATSENSYFPVKAKLMPGAPRI